MQFTVQKVFHNCIGPAAIVASGISLVVDHCEFGLTNESTNGSSAVRTINALSESVAWRVPGKFEDLSRFVLYVCVEQDPPGWHDQGGGLHADADQQQFSSS